MRPGRGTIPPPRGKDPTVGRRLRLALRDGRSGLLAVRAAEPNRHGATVYTLQGIGALDRNT